LACRKEGRFDCESCLQSFIWLTYDRRAVVKREGLETISASSKLMYQCIVAPDGAADAMKAAATRAYSSMVRYPLLRAGLTFGGLRIEVPFPTSCSSSRPCRCSLGYRGFLENYQYLWTFQKKKLKYLILVNDFSAEPLNLRLLIFHGNVGLGQHRHHCTRR
jgi:hypothetical protein